MPPRSFALSLRTSASLLQPKLPNCEGGNDGGYCCCCCLGNVSESSGNELPACLPACSLSLWSVVIVVLVRATRAEVGTAAAAALSSTVRGCGRDPSLSLSLSSSLAWLPLACLSSFLLHVFFFLSSLLLCIGSTCVGSGGDRCVFSRFQCCRRCQSLLALHSAVFCLPACLPFSRLSVFDCVCCSIWNLPGTLK